MKILKKVITYIIAFILTISIILCILVFLISSTILNKSYILEKLDETDYYSKVYELVESNFENYIQQSGLDEAVIDGIISKDKVKEDTEQILINLYDGLNEEISTQEIADSLNANITSSLGDRVLTSDEEEAIATFVETICEEYENTILHTNYEEQINSAYQDITEYVQLAKQGLSIAVGISIILLILINNKSVYLTVRGVSIASLASGIIMLIINNYINSKIKIDSIIIFNDAFSDALISILEEIMNNIIVLGCSLSILGAILIIVSNLIHNIKRYGVDNN